MKPEFEKYIVETMRKLKDPGLLLVGAKRNGKANVMTIGWGLVGVLWRTSARVGVARYFSFWTPA